MMVFSLPPNSPNKQAAPNPAMTSLFHAGRYWRGIGEPGRSAESPRTVA